MTPTPIDPAVLAGVLADPDSDLPRMVAADWCDDHATYQPCPVCCPPDGVTRPGVTIPGTVTDPKKLLQPGADGRLVMTQPRKCERCDGRGEVSPEAYRAEFIRCQCRIAAMPECPWSGTPVSCGSYRGGKIACEQCRLEPLAMSILSRHADDWLGLPGCGWTTKRTSKAGLSGGQPVAVWERGFVGEIRGPLATLRGDVCGRCGGTGMSEREYHGETDSDGGCPGCSGTGRTVGVLRGLVRTQPVTRVVATCRQPAARNGRYWWVAGEPEAGADHIPFRLFDRLRGAASTVRTHRVAEQDADERAAPGVREDGYATEADATDALSAALLAEAKAGE